MKPKPKSHYLVDGKYSFRDLVNIDRLKRMFEYFSKLTGFGTGLIGLPDHDILFSAGWCELCLKFHRQMPESKTVCIQDNLKLVSKLQKSRQLEILQCKNGVIDAAIPIIIKGSHIADLVTGQVFFEKPDMDYFRKQGENYGYDIEKYLEAVAEVPIVSEKELTDALIFLKEMAVMLAEQGLNNLQHIEASRALAESENKFKSITENALDFIFIKDIDRKYTFANRAMQELLGLPENEIVGKKPVELYGAEQALIVKDVDDRTFAGDIVYETREMELGGRKFHLNTMQTPLTWQDGKVTSIMGIVRDVTEQRRAIDELQTLEKLKSVGILAAGIAHDFNNILMGIYGNIALAKDMVAKNHPAMESLEDAHKSMSRATYLTKQLLTFAKGGMPVREDISLDELVREVVNFDLSGSNIKAVFKKDKDLWCADADKGQIHQVFSNLTINAMQSMPDGGKLTLTLRNHEIAGKNFANLKPGKYIRITVEDTGAGIEPKDLGHIFDPYFSTKKAGSGLGLATVYSIINRHGGHISVNSVPKKGTTFTIFLPASKVKKLPDRKQPEPVPSPGRDIKVLVMDDEEIIRMVVTDILKKNGFEVETADDGEKAIKLYRQSLDAGQKFGMVIMDLTIPGGMGGKDAIRKILEIDPEAKVIVSSGYSENPIMANYREFGFKGIAKKPYTVNQLLDEINRVLNE